MGAFVYSIERDEREGGIFEPYHLGTCERDARSFIEDRFHGIRRIGYPIVSIGLHWHENGARTLRDVFDGEWNSERQARFMAEG